MAHDHYSRRDTARTLASKLEREGWSSATAARVAEDAAIQAHRLQDRIHGTGKIRGSAEVPTSDLIEPWPWAKKKSP